MKVLYMLATATLFFIIPVSAKSVQDSAVNVMKSNPALLSKQNGDTHTVISKAEKRKQRSLERKKLRREARFHRQVQTLVLRMTGGYGYFSLL